MSKKINIIVLSFIFILNNIFSNTIDDIKTKKDLALEIAEELTMLNKIPFENVNRALGLYPDYNIDDMFKYCIKVGLNTKEECKVFYKKCFSEYLENRYNKENTSLKANFKKMIKN
jgi:hypothetical protein